MQKKKAGSLDFKVTKNDFSFPEQKKLILLSLLANPDSILPIRSYIGILDKDHFSKELIKIKQTYGNLENALKVANAEDFGSREKNMKRICRELKSLRDFIEEHKATNDVKSIIDILFPNEDDELKNIRSSILLLMEPEDSLKDIYRKFIELIRDVSQKENSIRVMSLLASKGLDADHVYILGCNDGNLPGKKRSSSTQLTDHEYKQERRRLLFVGITRARKSVTITWSRTIPFAQSKSLSTESIRTVEIRGKKFSLVGLSEFLQGIKFP